MRGYVGEPTTPKNGTHAPAADTAAIVTIAANAEERWVIDWIDCSFNVTPDGPKLLNIVSPAGTTLWSLQLGVTTADPANLVWHFPFPHGIWAAKGDAVVVTLAADGGGAFGKVNVGYR